MDKLLKGVLRFNDKGKAAFAAEIKKLGQSLQAHTVMISCVDARVFPSKFTDTSPGDMFIVRNAGNMVPDYKYYEKENMVGTEGAALELGVVMRKIKNIVVCGHSDCKAVIGLYDLKDDCDYLKHKKESSLLTWITLHGKKSITSFQDATKSQAQSSSAVSQSQHQPLVCSFNIGNRDVTARIDPSNDFGVADKLSQFHCLQQASHLSTYPFLSDRMDEGKLNVHAMWFDLDKGDVYVFSPKLQQFAVVDGDSVKGLLAEVKGDSS